MVNLVLQLILQRIVTFIGFIPHLRLIEKNYWGGTSIFSLQNTLVILSFLLNFICPVALLWDFAFISLCVWLKNPYIEKSPALKKFLIFSQKKLF